MPLKGGRLLITGLQYCASSCFLGSTNNGPTGRKRAPGSTGGMQQCQNHWQAWHILQCAQSSRSDRKEEKFGEKSGKLRSRCGFARTQAFWHGWHGIFCRARSGLQHDCLDMFTKRDTETQPHRHTETRTQAVFLTASARHCPCPGCKSLLGHGPAPARELVCTVQAPAARC